MAKFLIIRFSSIGDIVLTTPVVRCLRKKYPDAEIHFLTRQSFKTIVENNPFINKVHTLGDSFELMLHELKTEEYDYIIDLHHNVKTLRVKRHLKKVKSFSFYKLNIQKWFYTVLKINTLPSVHIVDRYLDTVKKLGVENDGMGLDYFIPENEKVKDADLPTVHLLGYIAVVIGAAHATKRLPIEKLKELSKKINYPVILLGGKEDYETGKQIAAEDDVKIYNACGKFSLHESADLVKRSKLVIAHDTGLMHIAAAFGKTILSVWGNTVPAFGMYPYKTHYEVFEKKLGCRPCSKIGYNKCPRGHFKCMKTQSMDLLAERAMTLLKK